MDRFPLSPTCTLVIEEGDLTRAAVDAIVNAANEAMLGGGGVDGAIHRAAGPELVEACREVPEISPRVRCPTGEACITPGFRLPAKHVIHTVGPIYSSAEESAPLLESAYRSSLELANENGLGTIAFPAISCGVFAYPKEDAAQISLRMAKEHFGDLSEVRFVLFGEEMRATWAETAERLL